MYMHWFGLEGAFCLLSHSSWKCLIKIRIFYTEYLRMAHWNLKIIRICLFSKFLFQLPYMYTFLYGIQYQYVDLKSWKSTSHSQNKIHLVCFFNLRKLAILTNDYDPMCGQDNFVKVCFDNFTVTYIFQTF